MQSIKNMKPADLQRCADLMMHYLSNPLNPDESDIFTAAQMAARQHPQEWAVFFYIGDACRKAGLYTSALKYFEHCVQLRPRDILSVYLMGVTFTILTIPKWTEEGEEAFRASSLAHASALADLDLDKASAMAIAGIFGSGLTVVAAAQEAMRVFRFALTLDPDPQSRAILQEHIAFLQDRFPEVRH